MRDDPVFGPLVVVQKCMPFSHHIIRKNSQLDESSITLVVGEQLR